MKKLTIVRHAKSDWGNEGLQDLYRPLNQVGYIDASVISKQLAKKIAPPDYWLSSPSIRTYSTAVIFANTFKYNPEGITINKKMYEATAKTLKQILSTIPDKYNHVILFGHNPGVTNFFNEISDSYADTIPTCGVMHLTSSVSKWNKFMDKELKNDFYLYPKEFK